MCKDSIVSKEDDFDLFDVRLAKVVSVEKEPSSP
jgi:hypothetical protein